MASTGPVQHGGGGGGVQAGDAASPTGESYLLSLLNSRAERKDIRTYAHAASETQTIITDSYGASTRPASRPAGQQLPINTQEPGFLEVFPRVTSRPPRLLQDLESIMLDRLRCADKAAWPGGQLPKDRDPHMAANLSLDAHRQVFSAFIQGFSTYTSLLTQIQEEFERALSDGLRCAAENVELRVKMAEEAAKREVAGQAVRAQIMAEEAGFRRAAFAKLQETRERTARLTRRAAAAERELASAREQQERLHHLAARLRATRSALTHAEQQEGAWHALPTSNTLQHLAVGPLTQQDASFLEQEYTPINLQQQRAATLQRTLTLASVSEGPGGPGGPLSPRA